MAHYAFLDENNLVTEVITGVDEDDLQPPEITDWEVFYSEFRGQTCKRTSYNTHGGEHPDGTPFRYNYAGIGFTYDPDFGADGAFIPPQPFPSWTLNPSTALWDAPTPTPETEGMWTWDEDTLSWIDMTPAE
jgi:hypothetical protein